jgi:hypothetical protein
VLLQFLASWRCSFSFVWPEELPDAAILERLVALNRERAAEEAAGRVRWLRPEYQAR